MIEILRSPISDLRRFSDSEINIGGYPVRLEYFSEASGYLSKIIKMIIIANPPMFAHAFLGANIHLSSQGVVVKPGEYSTMLCDGCSVVYGEGEDVYVRSVDQLGVAIKREGGVGVRVLILSQLSSSEDNDTQLIPKYALFVKENERVDNT